jgi:hypothetical protein
MSIDFLLDILDFHLLQIDLHLLSVFCCDNTLVSTHDDCNSKRIEIEIDFQTWKREILLNEIASVAGASACAFPNIFTSIAMVERAFEGSKARKLRTVLPDRGLKGEKLVFTAVMYLVSIVTGVSEIVGSALEMPSRPAVYVPHSYVAGSAMRLWSSSAVGGHFGGAKTVNGCWLAGLRVDFKASRARM